MLDFLNDAYFPNFKRFTSSDFEAYELFYKSTFAPYGDISPTNLLVWLDIDGTLEIARLDDAIVLKYSNPFENLAQNYVLLEPIASYEHIEAIFSLAKNRDLIHMNEQPASPFMHLMNDQRLIIEPNRDSYEYILSTAQHTYLEGKAFSRQRRRVAFFEREHEDNDITIEYLDKPDEIIKSQLLDKVSSWQLNSKNDDDDLNREFEALMFAIQSLENKRECLIIRINGEIASFTIHTIFDDNAIIGHLKVDYDIQYMFDYTTHHLAKELFKRGIAFMNFEQDLGIPGLRDHKMRLRPVKMLEKINIRLAETNSIVE
jgi:hypothetical protein